MVDLVECLTNLLFFGIQLFYYYAGFSLLIIYYLSSGICILIHTYVLGTNPYSSITCFLSSGDMYLFLCVVNCTSSSSSSSSSLLLDFFETLVILSAILLPIKSPVASAVFWIALFEAVFVASVFIFISIFIT